MKKKEKNRSSILVLCVYAYGVASVVFPLFGGIVLLPVFNYFSVALPFLKHMAQLWAFVAGLNASALYLAREGYTELARKIFNFATIAGIVTFAAFGIAPFLSILASSHVSFYEKVVRHEKKRDHVHRKRVKRR